MSTFFNTFQLVSLMIFFLLFIGRTVQLRIQARINPIQLGVGKTGFRRMLELAFFAGFLLWTVEVVLHSLQQPHAYLPSVVEEQLHDFALLKYLGVGMIVVGLAIFAAALISFGNSWRIGIDKRSAGELVTTGVFALSRNPIFLFMDLYFVATFLINGQAIFLIIALATVAGLHIQILQEEAFLMEMHGQAYRDYIARTRRYIGWTRSDKML